MVELGFPPYAQAGGGISDKKNEGNSLMNQVIAISRALARSQINWTVEERMLFVMTLTKIDWKKEGNSNFVVLNKKEVVEALKLKINAHARSTYLRNAFQKLARDSEIHWTDPRDRERWKDIPLIISRESLRGKIIVEINPRVMPHLEALTKDQSFITMLSSDFYNFTSRFSFALYDELRLHYDSRKLTNLRFYTTQQLKKIFRLKKSDYVRKSGKFDRYQFEKKTIDLAISEINKGQMMTILPMAGSGEKMKFYSKVYENGEVKGYMIKYIVRTYTYEYVPELNE